MRRSALIALIAVLCAAASLSIPALGKATGIAWSPGALVDNQPPFVDSPQLFDVSCLSSGFCAAGEALGVEVSDQPARGAGSWRLDPVAESAGSIPQAMSCPTRQLCAELVFEGDPNRDLLVTSGHPTEGSGGWTVRSAPPELSALACPTQRVCLATGEPGLLITTHPRAGRSAWRRLGVGTSKDGLEALACHGSRMCIAAGTNDADRDEVAISTRPATGRAWRLTTLPRGLSSIGETGVACASARLCVVADDHGHVLTSTDPSAIHPRWRLHSVPGSGADLACPGTSLCVSSAGPRLATSTDGGRHWQTTTWSPPDHPVALACGSVRLCVAVDWTDDVLASVAPAHGATGYSRVNLGQGTTAIHGLACPSASFCIAEGADGRTLRSTGPVGGAAAWNQPGATEVTGRGIAESCPSLHFCAGESPDYDTWVGDPTLPAQTWVSGPPGHLTGAVSCASSALCVAVGSAGDVFTSTDPLGGPASWTTAQLATPIQCDHFDPCSPIPLVDISCPTATFCAVLDGAGGLWTSADPTTGSAWARHLPPGEDSSATTGYGNARIACPTASLCLIAEADQVQSTEDPLDAAPTWTSVPLAAVGRPAGPDAAEIAGLSCATAELCVAVDGLGFAFSGDPADAPSSPWTSARLTKSPLTAVSCAPSSLCVAGDEDGNVYAGQLTQ